MFIKNIISGILSLVIITMANVTVDDKNSNLYKEVPKSIISGEIEKNFIDELIKVKERINFNYTPEDFEKKKKELLLTGEYTLYVNKDLKTKQNYQETSYYCGPATLSTVSGYYNDVYPKQDELAIKLRTSQNGTDIEDLAKQITALNKKNHTYEVINVYSINELAFYIKENLEKEKLVVPEIATLGLNWPYFTEGHYFVISGAEIYSKGVDINGMPIEPIGVVTVSDSAWAQKEGENNTYSLEVLYQGVEQFWGNWIIK